MDDLQRSASHALMTGRARRAIRQEIHTRRDGARQERYSQARAEFTDGDVLLFRGRGPMSRAIRFLTASPYSHVGLVLLFEGRVYCVEAVGKGVRLILMSEAVRQYHGGIDYYRLHDVTPEQRRGALGFCLQQLGKLYDHAGLVRFLAVLALGHKPRAWRDRYWFCSELVAAAYRTRGISLAQERPAYTSPADLAMSPRLQLSFVIKPDA